MPARKTHEQFMKDFMEKNPNAENIEVLGKYTTNKTPIDCKCKVCGYGEDEKWSPQPRHLLSSKSGCPQCGYKSSAKKREKTHEQFVEEFMGKSPKANDIILKSQYNGAEGYIKCECAIDGYTWDVTAHNLLKGRGCPQCAIRNFLGENNPRWNSELTQEDREQDRNNAEYKRWRDECFKRDNYTCQVTQEVGGRLEVHHIYSYDKHKELRLDVDNGVTISKDIHKLFHSIYGYGNNTKEQWIEFIENLK